MVSRSGVFLFSGKNSMSKLIPAFSDEAVREACRLLREGKVIAVPTDTVYGLAVDPRQPRAVEKLFQVKGRNQNQPIAVCVNRIQEIKDWGVVAHLPEGLLRSLLPGPVTLLLPRNQMNECSLNEGSSLVGVRIPQSDFISRLTKLFGHGIALTSANASNEPSTLSPDEFKDLWPELSGVFDGGRIGLQEECRNGSTIIDLSLVPSRYRIVRIGHPLNYQKTRKTLAKFGFFSEIDA